jgi:uncharacterized membrane protein YeiH
MTTIYLTDLVGTGVFAISGTLSALHRKRDHDIFTLFFFAFVTAIGGGTLRDVLINANAAAWLFDANYLIVISMGVVMAVIGRRWLMGLLQRPLLVFDTLGMAIFTILGLEKALSAGVNNWAATLLGIGSALFGGVIRDTLANEQPVIFERQLYITPCLTGALLYLTGLTLAINPTTNYLLAVGVITSFRLLAIHKGWALPPISL